MSSIEAIKEAPLYPAKSETIRERDKVGKRLDGDLTAQELRDEFRVYYNFPLLKKIQRFEEENILKEDGGELTLMKDVV
jgi:hypothetical protein